MPVPLVWQVLLALWYILTGLFIGAVLPPPVRWVLVAVLGGISGYYGAILGGRIKEPMMAHFRHYGEERRLYPLPSFLLFGGLGGLLLAYLIPIPLLRETVAVVGVLAIASKVVVDRSPWLREALPRWYCYMLRDMTRQERRAIAYAWLRLPWKTRLRLNGDPYAFQIFLDEIRMTVIYGARDADDPWLIWS